MRNSKGYLIETETHISSLIQTINALECESKERAYLLGLVSFYEYALFVFEGVNFESDADLDKFYEMLNNEISCYKDNKNSKIWRGIGVPNGPSFLQDFGEKNEFYNAICSRFLAQFVLLLCENISSNIEFSHMKNAKLGLYELVISVLRTVKFSSKNAFEEFLDSLAVSLEIVQTNEEILL